jgi:hypothetical protein
MISHKELVYNPENYQPLGSLKSVRNLPCEQDFTNINIESIFHSRSNMTMLSHNIYKVSRQNGGRSSIDKFNQLIPRLANTFCKDNNINNYETAESSATGEVNWVALLKAINLDFTNYCYTYLRWNVFVPTREWAEVGPSDNRVQKKFSELTAADAPTLDLWKHQEIQLINKHFRYGNKIPIWQKSMAVRHYDRGNEGLHHNDPDRASLENPVYGYDMSNINDTIDKWTSTGWFGM